MQKRWETLLIGKVKKVKEKIKLHLQRGILVTIAIFLLIITADAILLEYYADIKDFAKRVFISIIHNAILTSIILIAQSLYNKWTKREYSKAYGSRHMKFNEYVSYVERIAANSKGEIKDRYKKLCERMKLSSLSSGNSKIYIDGFIDYVFKYDIRTDKIILKLNDRPSYSGWRILLADFLRPYETFLRNVFHAGNTWNELKLRLSRIEEGSGKNNRGVQQEVHLYVEPISFFDLFAIHLSPDIRLPGKSKTIRDLIEPLLLTANGTMLPLQYYDLVPVPAGLGLATLIVLCNRRSNEYGILLAYRGKGVAVAPNSVSSSLAGSLDYKSLVMYTPPPYSATLRDFFIQEAQEREELATLEGIYLLPLAIGRAFWTLGDPGIYMLSFTCIGNRDYKEVVMSWARLSKASENQYFCLLEPKPRDGSPQTLKLCEIVCSRQDNDVKDVADLNVGRSEVCEGAISVFRLLADFFSKVMSEHRLIVNDEYKLTCYDGRGRERTSKLLRVRGVEVNATTFQTLFVALATWIYVNCQDASGYKQVKDIVEEVWKKRYVDERQLQEPEGVNGRLE